MNEIIKMIFSNIIASIGVSVAVILLGVSILLYRKILDWGSTKLEKIKNNRWCHVSIDQDTKDIIDSINSDLSALRAEMDGDRAYIFEFHNGSTFASRMPQWRISQTYERVRAGISYEGSNLQNIFASTIWHDFLTVLFRTNDNDYLPKGITKVDWNRKCKNSCTLPRTTYLINVSELDISAGPTKAMLESQGVYFMLNAPILSINNDIIGFVGIDYCESMTIEEIKQLKPCRICRFAAQVALTWELDPKLKKQMLLYQQLRAEET